MMNKQTRTSVIMAVTALCEAFGREATEATHRAYMIGLSGLSAGEIEAATAKALQHSKFMPSPAELRELAGDMSRADRAQHAWVEFEQAVLREGGYRSVDFADPLINATVRFLGGWTRCCDLPPEEFDKWLRKDFMRQYEAFARHPPAAEALVPLTGIHAMVNGVLGYKHKSNEPKRIGTNAKPLVASPSDRKQLGGSELGRQLVKQIVDAGRSTL